jgi:hypothetical protein
VKVELWSLAGSFVTAALLYGIKRAIDWRWPPGYHSRKVSRYGVRSEESAVDDGGSNQEEE